MILDATTKSLEVKLGGSVTSNQLPVMVSYADITTTTMIGGEYDIVTNDTTAVPILAAPGVSTQRQVKNITIYNADTVDASVIVQLNNNGTARIICKRTLACGETLEYGSFGWNIIEASTGASPAGVVPIGGVIMWSGTIANIPTYNGWVLCDGVQNYPGPDLTDQFVVGASADDAGAAKTNLTGSLTITGGSISHHHVDHLLTQPVVSSHVITQPVISNHAITQPNDHSGLTHTITQPVMSAHTITQPVVSSHVITQPVVSAHVITQPAVSTHLVTQVNVASVTATAVKAVSAVSAHSLSTSVAIATHTLATNLAIANHTLSTNIAIADHTLSTSVAVDSHAISSHAGTAISAHGFSTALAIADHTLSTNVSLTSHDTLAAPQPYYAIAYIQRMV
jgi:hypothetical protein